MKQSFDPADLEAVDRYKLMSGLIVPRPIGWIGSRSDSGVDNLAPFSFFNMVAGTPPTLLFTTGMTARTKDTLSNVRSVGAFSVNVVTEETAVAMNASSEEFPPEVDEFVETGLEKAEGEVLGVPMVAAARANLECVVTYIHEVGDVPSAAVVFGEVRRIHVAEDLLDGTRIDFEGLRAVGRLAGSFYTRTDLFSMDRP